MIVAETKAASNRRLTRAWLVLVGLTLVSLTAALAVGRFESGLAAAAVALCASYIKARQVLDHFLDLRRAGSGWRAMFSGLLVVILGGLMAAYVAAG
ncbi:MAG: cytochrome C oxidase subunit IV family protein [Magnetospirillum sp.]|nr:cytochrome C oxidase subunit IV family protein [Magnetospirillum sp.]